jgi:hypothetical protein
VAESRSTSWNGGGVVHGRKVEGREAACRCKCWYVAEVLLESSNNKEGFLQPGARIIGFFMLGL